MSKLSSGSCKDSTLNIQIKSKLSEKKIRKLRKSLLSLTEMDIKSSQPYNVIVIKKSENENQNAMKINIPLKNYQEDSEQRKENEGNLVNEIYLDSSEQFNSSDFDNEDEDC